ncbi:S9 family peptidase [Alteromonas sp. CYL-A6]|uniref:S9 family peptidase n=1 Tax=Alteromonas nitratireducens TaxID=3390813 RepID=UPI0034ADF14A
MNKITTYLLAAGLAGSLSACVSTADSSAQQPVPAVVKQTITPDVVPSTSDDTITLKQIMSDPQWLGRQPESMGWSLDGAHIVYERERENSHLNDVYAASVSTPENATKVSLDKLHEYRFDEKVTSADGKYTAFKFEDSVYVRMRDNAVVQLTRGGAPLSNLTFMTDNRLMAQSGSKVVAINLTTGQREELVSWSFSEEPVAVKPANDYIAAEQQSLIAYIAKVRQQRQDAADDDEALARASHSVAPAPFYFDPNHQLVAASVSPNGQYAIVATAEKTSWRDDSDIMPHYIQEDARIKSVPARRRVADAKPVNHELWLLDLATHTKQALPYTTLPGFNEDVLAEVKRENARAKGETYEVNRLPRDIILMNSWDWRESSIQWHNNGEQVAIMLEAWDNKDRWIATVDFEKSALVSQHRLHDDAWINYSHNQFGWLNNSERLFFVSEESGYAHLYLMTPGQSARALTSGQFVTDNPTLTKDDQWLYFTANKTHPGVYEVYRVSIESGEIQAMTSLNGITEYALSPDERHLLLSHSKVTRPAELYLKAAEPATEPKKVTDTISEAFLAMPWAVPQVVAIPSSHTEQPIYARVYLPENYDQGEARRAVVFNHGAGYLQNAHLGWSGYFREFMFNSMLVQQGYVVIDMDYRASKGYGRDWRTAIYRQMGTPEVQDLQDGVNWLVENANVDRARIGTYGGSYGGFLTFMSMFTAPDLFKAGAALRPVTDWAHYNTGYTSNILNTPDVDPIAFERSSPIYFAEGLKNALLINAPMVDDNVFFQDSVRLVQRLIELEKENFETAIYPVEPHGFVQPSSWLDEYRRIYKLFETNL